MPADVRVQGVGPLTAYDQRVLGVLADRGTGMRLSQVAHAAGTGEDDVLLTLRGFEHLQLARYRRGWWRITAVGLQTLQGASTGASMALC